MRTSENSQHEKFAEFFTGEVRRIHLLETVWKVRISLTLGSYE